MQSERGEVAPSTAAAGPSQAGPGSRPDSHFSWLRTRLSAERTLMSWNRTSLSLISFGFTIYQFFDKFQEATVGSAAVRPEAPRNLGLALMITGTLGTLISIWQYRQIVSYLSADQFKDLGIREGLPHWSLPFAVTILLALIGIVTTAWVLVRG
jgi:putative membrane protein